MVAHAMKCTMSTSNQEMQEPHSPNRRQSPGQDNQSTHPSPIQSRPQSPIQQQQQQQGRPEELKLEHPTKSKGGLLMKRRKKRSCPICAKRISSSWFKSHMKLHNPSHVNDITTKRHHHTVIVDSSRGIYCSALNIVGHNYPVHVVKKTTGAKPESFCEHPHCIDMKETARNGGNNSYECAHIRSIHYAISGNKITFNESKLLQMKDSKFITEERYTDMLSFIRRTPLGMPLLVRLPLEANSSNRCIYLSIFAGDIQTYWSKIGRTIVSFDTEQSSFSCKCSRNRRYCIHKALAKLFVYQEMPDIFTTSNTDLTMSEETTLDPSSPDIRPSYPVSDISAEDMLQYIMDKKRIPEQIPKGLLGFTYNTEYCRQQILMPHEKQCHRCNGILRMERVNTRPKIVMMNTIITGMCFDLTYINVIIPQI